VWVLLPTARDAHALLSAVERGASVDAVAAGAVALAHTDICVRTYVHRHIHICIYMYIYALLNTCGVSDRFFESEIMTTQGMCVCVDLSTSNRTRAHTYCHVIVLLCTAPLAWNYW
jgi:hypothetical protein